MKKYKKDFIKLTSDFSFELFRFIKKKKYQNHEKHIINQILRSSSSIAANCIEAKYSSTRKEVCYRLTIALRETKETQYWLKFLQEICQDDENTLNIFENKLSEIAAIVYASVKKLKKSTKIVN